MRRRARRAAAAVVAALCSSGGAGQESLVCPVRECLPADAPPSERGTLCYTSTGGEQAFATCPNPARPLCTACLTTPPCESWCEAVTYVPLPMGSPCHLDRECGNGSVSFAACHFGVCREVLWASQRCDEEDEHTVCLYGAQRCVDGECLGLGTNQPCWDGYQAGRDLDCQRGWYCLRAFCVPQLPNGHTCYGEHPNECLQGHHCNLAGARPQCVPEYSLPDGSRASDRRLCFSSHIDPRVGECAPSPPFDASGAECDSAQDCMRDDGSAGDCRCKRWWDGSGAPGYCELAVPERERPFFLQFWELRVAHCHHNWPEDRCALELKEVDVLRLLRTERQATADPTLPIPECAHQVLEVSVTKAAARRRAPRWMPLGGAGAPLLPVFLWLSSRPLG